MTSNLLDDFSTEALRKDLLSGNKLTKEVCLFFSSLNQFAYVDRLQKQLREKNNGKKYLLILNDIWNLEWEHWISLKKLLTGEAKRSRIIVTTHSPRVPKVTSKCQPHVLKGWFDDDAWFLFKERAFEQRFADSTNTAFLEIGKQILERWWWLSLSLKDDNRYDIFF
ncbi:disease resistance protein RGA2-like [Gossypium australe]|uniref:Disease resistance protein RGA2-like n=1 Tax=Gossypium australe TaxID=47621 RepID=A0A5B6VS55_9ROSI|nr:disease resistance protein RGA2-like [Gossypium australe]